MARRDEESNPYAPPSPVFDGGRGRSGRGRPSTESTNAWCENELVVVPRFGGDLPERCVVCNRRTSFKLRRTFQWHNPGYYLLICAGWIVYLIVFFIVRKTAIVHVGLCEAHEARRKNGLYILWGGVVAGIFFAALGGSTNTPSITLLAFLGVLVAALVGAFQTRVVTVKKIDENYVYLVTGGEFMRSLPTSPDEEPPPPPRKKKKKKRAAPRGESQSAAIPPPWGRSADEEKAAEDDASEAPAEDEPSREPAEEGESKELAGEEASKAANEGESKEPVNNDESKGPAEEDASKKPEGGDDAAS